MKSYVKPELVYENFQLNQSIANCSSGGTPVPFIISSNGVTVFTAGCAIEGDPSKAEAYCIETGPESVGTFNS